MCMSPVSRVTQRTAARLLLSAGAAGAGAIHLALAEQHFAEWRPLGIAFVVAGAAQLVWAVALAAHDDRRVLRAGAIATVGVVAAYLLSRTVGLPVGPEAFAAEPVGTADLACCALEVPVALGALLLARRPGALRSPLGRRWTLGFVGSLALVASLSGTALANPGSHDHEHGHHEHVACPSVPVLTGVLDARGVDEGVTAYFRCQLANAHGPHEG